MTENDKERPLCLRAADHCCVGVWLHKARRTKSPATAVCSLQTVLRLSKKKNSFVIFTLEVSAVAVLASVKSCSAQSAALVNHH